MALTNPGGDVCGEYGGVFGEEGEGLRGVVDLEAGARRIATNVCRF